MAASDPEKAKAGMIAKRIASLLLLAIAGAQAKSEPGPVGFRLGLRASETDFALFAGPSFHAKGLVVSEDFWINPYRDDDLVNVGPRHWYQVKLLRYGFVTGIRYQLGGEKLSVLPGFGMENILGSYYGTDLSPDWETAFWGGLEVGFLKYQRLGVRYVTSEQIDHSKLRFEWTIQWH